MKNNMPKLVFGPEIGHHRFGPAANPELSENVGEMISHGKRAQIELRPDLLVGKPAGKQTKDLPLASA
jgi:hypothetical protein